MGDDDLRPTVEASLTTFARTGWTEHADVLRDEIARLTAALAASQARVAEMEAALRPFASIGVWLFAMDLPDETPLVSFSRLNGPDGHLTRGMFKAAHTALAPAAQADAGTDEGEGR